MHKKRHAQNAHFDVESEVFSHVSSSRVAETLTAGAFQTVSRRSRSKSITLPEESMNTRPIIGTVLLALVLVLLPGCDEILTLDGTLTPIAPAPTILSATPTPPSPTAIVAPTGAPTATPSVQRPGIVFGAQINADEIIPACNAIRQMGVKATTLWIRWSNVEPRKGVLRWDDADIALQNF